MALNSSEVAGKISIGTVLISAHSYPPYMEHGIIWGDRDPKLMAHCMNTQKQAIDSTKKIPSLRYVIIASRGPQYLYNKSIIDERTKKPLSIKAFNKNLEIIDDVGDIFINEHIKTVNALQTQGLKVIFLLDNPELGYNPRNCIPVGRFGNHVTDEKCPSKTIEQVLDWQNDYRKLVNQLSIRNPHLFVFDSVNVFVLKESTKTRSKTTFYILTITI